MGEVKAVEYLQRTGYKILKCNYRCRIGEIDIVARKDEYLVFIEVKYRVDDRKGTPGEAIDSRKQRVISRVAKHYLLTHGYTLEMPCRFDVVLILSEDICIIENAFDYIE